MTGTVIMEVLCVAGVLFMIRFLVALFRDGKAKSPSGVVYLSLPSPQSENGVFTSQANRGHGPGGAARATNPGSKSSSAGPSRRPAEWDEGAEG